MMSFLSAIKNDVIMCSCSYLAIHYEQSSMYRYYVFCFFCYGIFSCGNKGRLRQLSDQNHNYVKKTTPFKWHLLRGAVSS